MAEILSIHRREDLRHARLLAEHVRQKLSAPTSAVTERVVAGLADMLQVERDFRQNEVARYRAEIAAACAEVNAEAARIHAVFDAVTAYVSARKALNEALAAHSRDPAARGQQATSR